MCRVAGAAPSDVPRSPYEKMARASEMAEAKRDLPAAVALAKEALPEVAGDPVALGMYCTILLDARALPGIDQQLSDCIAHLYVLDPAGMKSNYLGAIVAALHGDSELARSRLDAAKRAGLPDAAYAQLMAQLNGVPAAAAPPPGRSTGKLIVAFGAGAVGTAALVLLGLRLLRRRRAVT